jgi:hypothetical protein
MLVKQLLIKHVRSGEWLDLTLGPGELLDEAAMRSWGDSRTCPAEVIRDILRGRLVADPDPHGVRLRGARISGRLDLEDLTTDVNLELRDCFFEEGVLARGARLAAVALTRCQLEHPADPPLDAARLTCSVLDLSGHATAGAVNLHGAHIDGSLDCDGASLRNDSGPALSAEGLLVDQSIVLYHGFRATGAYTYGAVYLRGAHIGGNLDCRGAQLLNDSGPALSATGVQVGQTVFLSKGFTAKAASAYGTVYLPAARIGGSLDCDGAWLTNKSGPALRAERDPRRPGSDDHQPADAGSSRDARNRSRGRPALTRSTRAEPRIVLLRTRHRHRTPPIVQATLALATIRCRRSS